MRSRLLIHVLVVFLLVTLSSSGTGRQGSGISANSPKQGPLTSLPKKVLEAELKSALGGSFRLSDYSGSVLVVTLWATWCGPCRLETPALVKLHEQFLPEGVQIVELSPEDPEASDAAVREWIHDYGVPYRVGWATPKVATSLMQGRDAIPQCFVISRSGRIVKRFIGFNPTVTPPLLELAIRDAINDQGGPSEQD